MNPMSGNAFIHLKQFADHKNVEIAAISKKDSFIEEKGELAVGSTAVITLKKLDIAHLPSEKLRKYHEEGRIAFILDGGFVQFNKTFAEENLCNLAVCHLKVKPAKPAAGVEVSETAPDHEILKNVAISHLEQDEYDEIMSVCHEILASFKKESGDEKSLHGKVKAAGSYDTPVRQALRALLMKNILNEMSDISKRFIESMEKSREEDRAQQEADAKKQQELKERLTRDRLTDERLKKDLEVKSVETTETKETVISDEKREALERKTGEQIGEYQA